MSAYEWRPYVPVATRRARALREIRVRRKRGEAIEPVEIAGRKIAHTFWGHSWCEHLEGFRDYENRLPRGRTYVRNGSVFHLGIAQGHVHALVMGSELYEVRVEVTKLPQTRWRALKKRCAGGVGSLLELLAGRLSKSVMSVVTDRQHGLFPLAKEIRYECSCPDWAAMCKHVAATFYGVGARLDERPDLLFLLRGVDHEELIDTDASAIVAVTEQRARGVRRRIAEDDLADVFDIEMAGVESPTGDSAAKPRRGAARRAEAAESTVDSPRGATVRSGRGKPSSSATRGKGSGRGKRSSSAATGKASGRGERASPVTTGKGSGRGERASPVTAGKGPGRGKRPSPAATGSRSGGATASGAERSTTSVPRSFTGAGVARLRADFEMSRSQLARLLEVSGTTIGNWESTKGRLNLQQRTLEALRSAAALTRAQAWRRLEGG